MAGGGTALIAGLLLSAAAIAANDSAQDKPSEAPPSGAVMEGVRQTPMGPVCWAAIVESIRQIGLRCFPGENPEAAAALDRTSEAMGEMFLERGWSPQQLEAFRRQMGEADTPTTELCASEDAIQMYRAFAAADRAELDRTTQEMVARPGPPQWGTCL